MSQRLSELSIANLIGDPVVYSQGRSIQTSSGLKLVRRNGHTVSGVIFSGRLKHQVDIQFGENLSIVHWQCTCGESIDSGFCCHAAAMLLGMTFNGDVASGLSYEDVVVFGQGGLLTQGKGEPVYGFEGFLETVRTPAMPMVPFHIEISCICHSYSIMENGAHSWQVTMKAGVDRFYVVSKIAEFAKSVTMGKRFVFGKKLTFDPEIHQISETDRELLRFLHMVTGFGQSGSHNPYGYSSSAMGRGNGKELVLTEDAVIKGFLERLEERAFDLSLDGRLRKGPLTIEGIIHEDLQLPLSLEMISEDGMEMMTLSMPDRESLVPLNGDGSYQLFGDRVYRFTEPHIASLEGLCQRLDYHGNQLTVPKEKYEDFVTKVYPSLKMCFQLTLPQAVADKVRRIPVQPRVYFEQANRGDVLVRLVFHYEKEEGTFIIRDLKTEASVRQLFSDYSGDDDGYLLSGSHRIYRFAKYRLPVLREKAEIYYERGMSPLRTKFPKITSGLHMGAGAWLEAYFEGVTLDRKDLEAVYLAVREKKAYVRLPSGSFIDLEDQDLEAHFNLIEELELTADQVVKGRAPVPLARALVMESREEHTYDIDRDLRYQQILERFKGQSEVCAEPPAHYKNVLRPYQLKGFNWLVKLADLGLGGILADDMGLGKTLQTIAFLDHLKAMGHGPFLVVAPTSLIYNWEEEAARFSPELKCLVMAGSKSERQTRMARIHDHDLIITSYNLVTRDLEAYANHVFGYCVLDEAQKIKNPLSKTAKAVKSLKAKGYLALTGTPMENNLTELWSVFDFVMPGYLHSLHHFRENHTSRGMNNKATKSLKQRISPFILRRLKTDVLTELPEKIETKSLAHMTHEQKKVYLSYMEHCRQVIDGEVAQEGYGKNRIKMLSYLTRLRQICCHPGTFMDNYQGGSGKMALLQEILEEAAASGHRVLLFSQFTSMLGLIEDLLKRHGMTYDYLDGSTRAKDRLVKVKAFNEGDTQVFLISLKAGGTGLNLTGADMVIHFDPWWNPAVEAQATDRAYRIGQKNRVQVIKLIAQGTIEEKIYDLQQRKKAMIDAVIEPGETMLSKMSEEEVLALFE